MKQYCIEYNLPKCWACGQSRNNGAYACTVYFYKQYLFHAMDIKQGIIDKFRRPMISDEPQNAVFYIKVALSELGKSEYIDYIDKYLLLI